MTFKMKITETVKTATGERHIEVEGEVNSVADRTELIQAVSAAARDARGFAEKAAQEETPNSGFALELPVMVCDQSLVSEETLKALKTVPAGTVEYVEQTTSVEEVKEILASNPVVPMVEGQFKAPVEKKDGPPPMFAPEIMKQIEERKNGAKAAPIVPQVAPFAPNVPTVLPTMFNPNPVFAIDYSQKTVPFNPPTLF